MGTPGTLPPGKATLAWCLPLSWEALNVRGSGGGGGGETGPNQNMLSTPTNSGCYTSWRLLHITDGHIHLVSNAAVICYTSHTMLEIADGDLEIWFQGLR